MEHWNGFSPGEETQWVGGSIVGGASLTCVGADVPLQQPRPGEALAAVRALAALIVGAHVHRVGRHRDVHLVAVRAAARLLVHQRAVRLPVAGQVGRRRVLLAALGADVHVLAVARLLQRRRVRVRLAQRRRQAVLRLGDGLARRGRREADARLRVVRLVAQLARLPLVEDFVRIVEHGVVFGRRERALPLIGERFLRRHVQRQRLGGLLRRTLEVRHVAAVVER